MPERDYYLRTGDAAEKTRQQYVQHLTTMLKLLGEPEAKAASDAQKIMELETALAKDIDGYHIPPRSKVYLPSNDGSATGGAYSSYRLGGVFCAHRYASVYRTERDQS